MHELFSIVFTQIDRILNKYFGQQKLTIKLNLFPDKIAIMCIQNDKALYHILDWEIIHLFNKTFDRNILVIWIKIIFYFEQSKFIFCYFDSLDIEKVSDYFDQNNALYIF